jgi:Aspartyl protease/PDZ domain
MTSKGILSFVFLCLLVSISVRAQEQFSEPPARRLTVVPLKTLSGGVVLIKAAVNKYPDSLNFILDTGSGGISLDSTTCIELNIPLAASDKTIRGIGGIRNVKFLNNAKLHLPGLTVDSLNFHVNDYEILTSVYGIKIDGIIGYSFLSRYIVKLNYDTMLMEVFTPGELKYPKGGHLLRPLLASIPIQTLNFKEKDKFQNRFYFDTGAGLSFLLSEDYIRDSGILKNKKKAPLVTQAEGLGGKMTMRLTTIKEVRLGPYKFKNVPTFLFDDDYNVTSYPFLGGLIGNDLLRRFNIILNYRKREIHIIPNRAFKEVFDYAYTGLGVYYVDGKVVVEDVVKDSPGEEGGFMPGDVILGINNNFSNNIQVYKSMMQNLGNKLKFVILRNGTPEVLYLKAKSIL